MLSTLKQVRELTAAQQRFFWAQMLRMAHVLTSPLVALFLLYCGLNLLQSWALQQDLKQLSSCKTEQITRK